jgi:hypothetical protein
MRQDSQLPPLQVLSALHLHLVLLPLRDWGLGPGGSIGRGAGRAVGVKEKLALRRVTGRLLSYCTSEEDLLDEVYGLSSKVLARGLMEQIKLWKANGV